MAGKAGAIGVIGRKGEPRMVVGLAAYSFRNRMRWMKGKQNAGVGDGGGWTMHDFIDYCADQGGVGAEMTSYFFPPEFDEAYLLDLKRHAYLRGVPIAGTAVGNVFTHPEGAARNKEVEYVKAWIRNAAVLGAPHIRVFAGDRMKDMSQEEAEANFLECFKECLELAAEKGVFLGLENHGGITAEADALVRMIRAVDSPWAGINLDSGNFRTEDPYGDLEKIAPYAVNVQMKTSLHGKGDAKGVPMDLPRLIDLLEKARYQGWFTLEYEDGNDAEDVVPRVLREMREAIRG